MQLYKVELQGITARWQIFVHNYDEKLAHAIANTNN